MLTLCYEHAINIRNETGVMEMHKLADILKMRKALVTTIADEFEQSGIAYTCGAVVMDFAQKRIVPLTEDWPLPVKVHPKMTFGRIKKAVWDEIHRRWKLQQGMK